MRCQENNKFNHSSWFFRNLIKIFLGVYKVEYSPPAHLTGGNKIKGFRDGEIDQKLEQKKKNLMIE